MTWIPVVEFYVWWCGDDVCDCTQAQIVRRRPNETDPRFQRIDLLWKGTFFSDGESGANEELQRAIAYCEQFGEGEGR